MAEDEATRTGERSPVRVARRAVVSGRVQGVYYRDSCRAEAERLHVAGSAENCADGTVLVVAEGEPAAVDQLLAWCAHGPERALVTGIEVRPEPVLDRRGFRTG
jgi:acylphosphatase